MLIDPAVKVINMHSTDYKKIFLEKSQDETTQWVLFYMYEYVDCWAIQDLHVREIQNPIKSPL